jgi:hypothetical protein
MPIKEADPSDKARRQDAMNAMLLALNPLDVSNFDLLEITLNMFANSVVRYGVDNDTAVDALRGCLDELRAIETAGLKSKPN